jgi:DNA topoisomerase-2
VYSAFKKNLTKEIKVAQFSGYVSEQSGYHHGEASLNKAIVGLAQNHVGSNNINLLDAKWSVWDTIGRRKGRRI